MRAQHHACLPVAVAETCRSTPQEVYNVMGALYLTITFLGIHSAGEQKSSLGCRHIGAGVWPCHTDDCPSTPMQCLLPSSPCAPNRHQKTWSPDLFQFSNHAAGGSIPVLAAERPVFYREQASRLYAAFPFAVAQVCRVPPCLARTRVCSARNVCKPPAAPCRRWSRRRFCWSRPSFTPSSPFL